MLYNKHRPESFDQVVGQKSAVTLLDQLVKSEDKFPNVILTGRHGTGKTTLARITARALGVNDIDIHELDAASNNTIEHVRSIVQQCRVRPQASKYKVFIIDEAHMISSAGFDTLLKVIEEPPEYVIFMFCTTELSKLKSTILSRCMVFHLKDIDDTDIFEHLKLVSEEEKLETEEDALKLIAMKARGSMRDALSYLQKCIDSNQSVTYDNTCDQLDYISDVLYYDLYDCIINEGTTEILEKINDVFSRGYDLVSFLSGLATYTRNLFVLKNEKSDKLVDISSTELKTKMKKQAKTIGPAISFKILNMISEVQVRFNLSNNKRLSIEMLCVNIYLLIKKSKK